MRAVGKAQLVRARLPSRIRKGRGMARTRGTGFATQPDWQRRLADVQAELKRAAKGRCISGELIAERKRER